MQPIRIALYGDINLNLVDGSAIWLASLAAVLGRIDRTELTVLRKAPPRRQLISAELDALHGVRVVGPASGRPLTVDLALDELDRLDRGEPFDIVILRGRALAGRAADRRLFRGRLWTYLTDIPQDPAEISAQDRARIGEIVAASARMLCQTEQLRGHLEALAPASTILLPPMVAPPFTAVGDRPRRRDPGHGTRLLYAGKFAPAWGVLETVDAIRRLRSRHADLHLHVAGDKIHDPPDDPAFRPAVQAALTRTGGLVWHGGVPRAQVAALLADTDIALSARGRQLDHSLELSTKLLEYCAAGVPVVCNRTDMHAELLGADYPLFIDDLDDLEAVLEHAVSDDSVWQRAHDTVRAAAAGFTYERVADRLRPHLLRRVPDVTFPPGGAPRVLVAGHDRKFFTAIADHLVRCGTPVSVDDWRGHARHDEAVSRELLDRADVVICEWALGNAVWYSHNLHAGQRLLVRLHRMELETEHPSHIAFGAVERAVVVSEQFRRRAVVELGWPADRIAVIPNWVDTVTLDRPKLPDARYHLSLLGWLPRRKRVDRALDVIERLAADDARWRLHLAGPLPWELGWVWQRLAEREWLTDQLDRIRRSPVLRRAVSVDGHQRNVASWLRGVGWVLSPSDDESFHLAPAEGMASGAVPVIWPWDTATEVYGRRWLCADANAAAVTIAGADWESERRVAQRFVRERYPLEPVVEAWADLVLHGEAAA